VSRGQESEEGQGNVRRVVLAEEDHVLRLGPRVAPKIDLARGTGHTGIGGGAEDREGWETEAEGCIDGTRVNRGLAGWR
jgi:hypothetical protein